MKFITSIFVFLGLMLLVVSGTYAQTVTPAKRMGLTDPKLRMCEAREDNIKNKMANLNRFSQNMFKAFDSIAERVDKYYTTKLLPEGKVVSNYATLVADVAAKKATVQTLLSEADNGSLDFDCSVENPKMLLTNYRTDMQNIKTALKNYRTSIKNLTVAVKSVAGSDQDLTPKPTKTN